MASLPDLDESTLTHGSSLAADRRPTGPTQAERLRARARVILQRFRSWLASGQGTEFRNYCPTALQAPFTTRYETKLNSCGYTLAFDGEQIVISVTE